MCYYRCKLRAIFLHGGKVGLEECLLVFKIHRHNNEYTAREIKAKMYMYFFHKNFEERTHAIQCTSNGGNMVNKV